MSPERPEHAACRERTDQEQRAVLQAEHVRMKYRERGGEWNEVEAYYVEGGKAYRPPF